MDCDQAMEVLTSGKTRRATVEERKKHQEAEDHLLSCAVCQTRIDQFTRAILSMAEDEIPCAECGSRLHAYVEAELDGQDMGHELPLLKAHLERCPDCSVEYQILRESLLMLREGTLPEPSPYPVFDTSFLQAREPSVAPRPIWLTEAVEQEVRRLFTEISITIGRTAASFGQLAAPLTPQPVPVGAMREERRPEGEEALQLLELPDPEANLAIELTVGPVTADKAAVSVEIGQMSPEQPIPRARVTLYDAEHQLLASTLSGDDGTAAFDDMDAGRYFIEIKHAGQVWELPVSLARPTEGDNEL